MQRALVVFIFIALVLTALRAIWGTLRTNITQIETARIVSQQDQDALRRLYWNYDISKEYVADAMIPATEGFSSDGAITANVILAMLAGNYHDVTKIAASDFDGCLRRTVCRLLAGKANYILGLDEAAVPYWRETNLWRKLVGKVAETPRDQSDFVRLDRYYNILLDVYPDRPDAYFMLGSIRRSLGKWEESLPYFEHAVMLEDGEHPRYLCVLGEVLIVTDSDVTRGHALCKEALALDPDDMWLYDTAGRALSLSGACDEALNVFLLAVERFPNRTESQSWLDAFQAGRIGSCTSTDPDQGRSGQGEQGVNP